jgi:hypothetical protein
MAREHAQSRRDHSVAGLHQLFATEIIRAKRSTTRITPQQLERQMPKTMLAAAAVALAVFTVPSAAAPTTSLTVLEAPQAAPIQVRWGGHAGFRHGGFHRGFRHGGFHRFHRGFFIGVPAYTYGYAYGGCRWLRHRALATGSPYWWRRYRLCRHGW